MAFGAGFNPTQPHPFYNITVNHLNGSTQTVARENQGFEIQLPKSRGIQEVIDYIDLIKEEFMKDPHSLSGCDHIYDEDTLTKHFIQNNRKKICPNPDCKKLYTTLSKENWLRQQIEKYISELNEPSLELKKTLSWLCNQLPDTLEKVTIIELNELFNKGQCEEASKRLTSMMRKSMNNGAYTDISSLMDTHVATLKEKHTFMIRKALSHRNRSVNGANKNSSELPPAKFARNNPNEGDELECLHEKSSVEEVCPSSASDGDDYIVNESTSNDDDENENEFFKLDLPISNHDSSINTMHSSPIKNQSQGPNIFDSNKGNDSENGLIPTRSDNSGNLFSFDDESASPSISQKQTSIQTNQDFSTSTTTFTSSTFIKSWYFRSPPSTPEKSSFRETQTSSSIKSPNKNTSKSPSKKCSKEKKVSKSRSKKRSPGKTSKKHRSQAPTLIDMIKQNRVISNISLTDESVRISDGKGNTPVHHLVRHYTARGVRMHEILPDFIKYGGDINAMNKNGNTPLHIAVKWAEKDEDHDDEWIKLLRHHGAQNDIPNHKGKTPIDYAKTSKINQAVK